MQRIRDAATLNPVNQHTACSEVDGFLHRAGIAQLHDFRAGQAKPQRIAL
jgi:hypothetical protein